jgi:hypothetical protein
MSLRIPKALALSVLCVLVLTALAQAQTPPPLPFSPWGTVKVNGANVPTGTQISAWCHGVQYAVTTEIDLYNGESWYSNLDISGDLADTPDVKEGCSSDETISFMVGSLPAKETASWTSGSSSRLDLTAGTPPTAVDVRVGGGVAVGAPVAVGVAIAVAVGVWVAVALFGGRVAPQK